MNICRLLSATALASLSVAVPGIAWAQDASENPAGIAGPSESTQEEAPAEPQSIIVTGSRIASPNLQSVTPILSVTAEELRQTGQVSIGDTLNDLPALNSTFSQSNSTRFLGTAGLSLLDLRGLGTVRTLTLVNGRRHVGSDILSNATSVDVNTIPSDLIDRVDTVTGGNSAIYGSDAIAGVVNFVLKNDYEGLGLRAQGGISEHGDAGAYSASLVAGKNFAEGRGNIAVNLEYARQNDFYASDRKSYRTVNSFLTVDTDPAGSINGSDGIPDRILYRDVRSTAVSSGGLILFGPGGNNRCGTDPLGVGYTCSYFFQPDGSLVPQTGARAGLAPNGSFVGGNGETLREGKLVQLLPQLDRYAANLIGHFDVSDAFIPFIEAKYVRTNVVGTGTSGPAFYQGNTIDGFYERPRLDNPYLSASARATVTEQLLLGGTNPYTRAPLTDAERAAIADGSFRFAVRRNLMDLGNRTEESRRETYRFVGGFRGTFNDDWNYEVSANYGEFKERTRVLGNLNTQRFLLAADAVRDPATGNIVCGSQLDPTRAYDDFGGNPDVLAADIAACQPLNPFGAGNISQAARDYMVSDTTSVGKITQFVGSAFLSGDSSQWFELPGGPVGFAVGAEYRRETASFRADPLVQAGYTFYNALTPYDFPDYEVKEAYGELRLPLLRDLPLVRDLTISASGRVSDYSRGSAGTVFAYSVGGEWSPVDDVRFRANYSRSVRAPNLTELYSSIGQNFAPGFVDPCSARNIATGSENRAANCAAAGRPANYDYVYQSSLDFLSGGNPNLKEETSDSYTYGVVVQPTFARGLSLSVDYYNIKVNDVITSPSAQQIANACYDASDLDNQFCGLIQRAGPDGGPNGEIPFQILEGTLQATLLNYAALQVRGIDTEIAYRTRFGENNSVGAKFVWTHQLENSEFLDPTDPGRANRLLSELGYPKDAFNFDLDFTFDKFFVNYQARYLGKMTFGAYEDTNSLQGRPPQNEDYATVVNYPDVVYMDVRLGLNVTEESMFYFGVDNFTDRLPPLYATGTAEGSGIYNNRGRYFYAGVSARF
ncbi:TonB-dependent receptor domain-containing protein [Sphingomonas sp. MJ1 (PH-R8)]|uniref:TonB-dependent receptor domain-containing protein n=1 Tax=Sphingomonas sp. MJ1 (PH-R8) TaxID=3112950 RepID=UPI003A8C4BA0